jgi:hypothetical protein
VAGSDATIVVLPVDDQGATLEFLLGGRDVRITTALPPNAPTEDVIAVLDHCRAIVTSEAAIAAVAISLGRPHALLTTDLASVSVMSAAGGGVAASIEEIESAIYRTGSSDSAPEALLSMQGNVDAALDELAAGMAALPDRTADVAATADPSYVRFLELTVAGLQRRLVTERNQIAKSFHESTLAGSMPATTGAGVTPRHDTLEYVADNYRLAIAVLQEQIHTLTRPVVAAPRRRTARSLAGSLARRLGRLSLPGS